MNASELIDFVESVEGSRESGSGGNGVVRGRLLSGIEYGEASSAAERTLRATWRKRHGGKATPLVLVADAQSADGSVSVIGPLAADGPIRVVGAEALRDLIARTSGLSDLRAVRLFAQELERLDSTGTPGLVVRGLGTPHLLETRLPRSDRWQRMSEIVEVIAGEEWIEVLRALGYEIEQLKKRGYLASHEGKPVAVVHPFTSPEEFSRFDESGTLKEGALLADCAERGAAYGILAAGSRLRLFAAEDDVGGVSTRYLELDSHLLEVSARPLLALLSPEYLQDGGFATIVAESRDYGAKLRERLDKQLRQDVLPVLGRELGLWAAADGRDLSDDSVRSELEGAALAFVFRALFLLYAESAGYLPMSHRTYRERSLTRLCQRAAEEAGNADPSDDSLWSDFGRLVKAMRKGQSAWGVPAYNGDLFSEEGLPGAGVLEEATISDLGVVSAFIALGRNPEDPEVGIDYSGLEIGHLGHVYEGLLSLRLSVADGDFRYDERSDRYVVPKEDEEAEVTSGELIWLTNEGGRKGGGVYYTRGELVRHLVKQAVRPALAEHLDEVRAIAEKDPAAAARQLFEFHVLDPSCGSAHFLVEVVGEIADRVAELLGDTALPAVREELEGLRATVGKAFGAQVEDAALLKRLVLKRCVFGVDISPMGAEIAKLSLWLASFVPGLSLAYLDRNIRVGNSLIGVASAAEVSDAAAAHGQVALFGNELEDKLRIAARAADELQKIPDRTPDEIEESRKKGRELEKAVEGARTLLDLWTAEPLGFPGSRQESLQRGSEILGGKSKLDQGDAVRASRQQSALHWPIDFPETFARDRPGFDVVVGNPPWEEVTVEELAFYATYQPGLRGMTAGRRALALEELKNDRPGLAERFVEQQERLAKLRGYLGPDAGYITGAGDPDVYKYFCQRYGNLVREGGGFGVVLPRSAFLAKGSQPFREWLFDEARPSRIDFLVNAKCWMFETHAQYAVALLAGERRPTEAGHAVSVAGIADSLEAFEMQAGRQGVSLSREALGPGLEFPLCPRQEDADLLARLNGTRFGFGGGQWRCLPIREFDETNDKKLWVDAEAGWGLWKGGSFEQFGPYGTDARACPPTEVALKKARKLRPGKGSAISDVTTVEERRTAVHRAVGAARVAFRDVTNRMNRRTVIACLVPPETFLTNKAPYLAFMDEDPKTQMACLAVMNSVPFDWQARRYVERNLNFFLLELFRVPELSSAFVDCLAERAARLSCPDDRFADFAQSVGIEPGQLSADERDKLRAEIDALVAQAWNLDDSDLDVMFADFTLDALPEDYRQAVRGALDTIPA